MNRKFEVYYEITVEYDSGRTHNLSAYSKTEYLSRVDRFLKDQRVNKVWVRRVESFLTDHFEPLGR